MSAELEHIQAQVAFYNEVGPLEEELEAARIVKADDPVRWSEAKQAFEEKRRFYRQIAEFLNSGSGIVAPAIDGTAEVTV